MRIDPSQLWPGCVIVLVIVITGLPVTRVFAQSRLASEFAAEAPEAWDAFRRHLFFDTALEVVRSTTDSLRHGDGDEQFHEFKYTRFADGNFKYYEGELRQVSWEEGKQDLNRRRVTALNPNYGFFINQGATSNWQVNSIDPIGDSNDFSGHVANVITRRELPDGLKKTMAGSFGDDPRLMIRQNVSIDKFYHDHKAWFQSFDERDDPLLGRVVTVSIKGVIGPEDLTSEQKESIRKRGRPAGLTYETTGTIEFLADEYWIPSNVDFRLRTLDGSGKEIRSAVETMSSTYLAGRTVSHNPATVVSAIEWSPSGNRYEESSDIRELTAEEIKKLRNSCYLTAFGINEPKWVKASWPIWIWIVLAGVGLTIFFSNHQVEEIALTGIAGIAKSVVHYLES